MFRILCMSVAVQRVQNTMKILIKRNVVVTVLIPSGPCEQRIKEKQERQRRREGLQEINTCVICYSPLWEERVAPLLAPSAPSSPTTNQDLPHEDVYSPELDELSLYLTKTHIYIYINWDKQHHTFNVQVSCQCLSLQYQLRGMYGATGKRKLPSELNVLQKEKKLTKWPITATGYQKYSNHLASKKKKKKRNLWNREQMWFSNWSVHTIQ